MTFLGLSLEKQASFDEFMNRGFEKSWALFIRISWQGLTEIEASLEQMKHRNRCGSFTQSIQRIVTSRIRHRRAVLTSDATKRHLIDTLFYQRQFQFD